MMKQEEIKKIVAKRALDFIRPHMKVGLGSGSTTQEFIKLLGEKIKDGLDIEVICASKASEIIAEEYGFKINNNLDHLDICVDGADEIDEDKNCLKGKGKALFREKILASMSDEFIILVDESKKSHKLHRCPVICEILPFGYLATIKHIQKLGLHGHLLIDENKAPVLTDNQNYLFEIDLKEPIHDPHQMQTALKHVPGVLETGLFYKIVNKVIVGYKDGQTLVY